MDKQSELENLFWSILRANDARLRRISRMYAAADEIQDLYQEILLQLWRSIDKYEGRSRPDTWAYKVALNTARSFRRRVLRRLEESHVNELQDLSWGTKTHELRNESHSSLSGILQDFIDSLNESDRMLFLMYLHDLSYQRISEITGLSRMHIAVKISRIKRGFMKYFSL